MRLKAILLISLLTGLLLVLPATFAASASSAPQGVQYATPTPQPDGRIIYIVQAGDNCTRIQLLTGVTVDELRTLNNLDADCTLSEGQQLLLGLGGPAAVTPTDGPSPTPTAILPTPTPFFGNGEICVMLYDDLNGNAIREPDTELPIPGGAVSVTGSDVAYSTTKDTSEGITETDYQGVCFPDAPEGNYTISMAIPDGYNATMVLNTELALQAGAIVYVSFGAQSQATSNAIDPTNEGGSPIMGIVGISLLLGGAGLAFYANRIRNKPGQIKLR